MRSAALYYAGCEESNFNNQSHFLQACFLCQKPLAHNSDIYMYRGNTPFCSQECRQEQIEIDDAQEKRWRLSSSSKRSNTMRKATDSATKESASKESVRTGSVAVA